MLPSTFCYFLPYLCDTKSQHQKHKTMTTTVIVKFEVSGFHQFAEAPNAVSFLSNRHRHTFKITCGYLVSHTNREKEIFMATDEVKSYLFEAYGTPCQFEDMSCEDIAKDILDFGSEDGMVWCEVWEEETGGARVEI